MAFSHDEVQEIREWLLDIDRRLQRIADHAEKAERPKARPDWFKRFTDSVTVAVLVWGFITSLHEVGRWQEGTDISAWNTLSAKWLEVDQFFILNSELRRYFYERAPVPSDESQKSKVEATAFYVLDFVDWVVNTSDYILTKHPKAKSVIEEASWETYFRRTFFTSPAICALLKRLPMAYSPGTRKMGLDACLRAGQ